MIAHVSVYVSNYEKAKEFYSKALAPVSYEIVKDFPEYKAAGLGVKGMPDLWIIEKTPVGGGHVAIMSGDKSAVDAFYKAALENGAKDNGAPGIRKEYSENYYAAFVLDEDGNNIEVVSFN